MGCSPAIGSQSDNLFSDYQRLAAERGLLPIKVTPFYQKKIDEEVAALGGTHGPLYHAMYPDDEKLDLHVAGEVRDWVDDRTNMPAGAEDIFIQKYPDRVLFTPTSTCAAHCLYCFRQDVLAENHSKQVVPSLREGAPSRRRSNPSPALADSAGDGLPRPAEEAGLAMTTRDGSLDYKLQVLSAHLLAHPEVSEVILSGGDPLTLSYSDLEKIFTTLQKIPSVKNIRIHSRAPIFAPQVLKDQRKIDLIAQSKARFVFHIIHPYEICAEVEDVMARMRAAGIPLFNHFPILRKINDHPDVLLALLQKLETLGVRTLSIYVPEPILHSATYRISYDRMGRIIDEVIHRSPSWLHAFRFCLDSPLGKVRRENLVMRDRVKNILVFQREGEKITYPDFPEQHDAPGNVATMLWKGV